VPKIRVLDVYGTPYQMGYQHGAAYASLIRELANERVHLSGDAMWAGRTLAQPEVLQLADACLDEHILYSPELMSELAGISDATGVSLPELLIANGFTDFVDAVYNVDDYLMPMAVEEKQLVHVGHECTSFMVGNRRTQTGQAMIGQTWDMHATATPYVMLLRGKPKNAPRFLTFTLTGCLGMIGMNEHGISVGINNLMATTGQPGVTWTFVLRKILMQNNLDDALECITSARLAGAHNYLLMDAKGRGYNVEAMPNSIHVTPLEADPIAHANRCVHEDTRMEERPLTEDWIEDSDARRERALKLLNRKGITPETLMALTRNRDDGSYSICSVSEAPYYSETCGAAIMRPATGEFWGVWGLPNQNRYERFTL
jgi:isopenicillin-N N-acyltransferase like protein